jgi:hypothetical protein
MRTLLAVVALFLVAESADAQKIRLRRMTEAAKDTLTYHTVTVGEPVYCTDSKKLYIFGSDSAFSIVGPDTVDVVAPNPELNFKIIPDLAGMLAGTASYAIADTCRLDVMGFYLDRPGEFVGAVVVGVATGSATYRNIILGVYDSTGTLLSSTQSIGHPGATTGAIAGFRGSPATGTQDTLVLAAGFYYMAISTYTSSSAQTYRGAEFSTSAIGGVILSIRAGGFVLLGTAANRCTTTGAAGDYSLILPQELGTLTRSTSSKTIPYVFLEGVGFGDGTE